MYPPRSPRYREEVNRILADIEAENNQGQEEQERETQTPPPHPQDTMQDVYVVFIRENPDLAAPQVVDSQLTGEPDTNVPHAPTLQPLTKVQAQEEKRSTLVALLTVSFFLFLCFASIALQIRLILNPPVAIITIIPKSQTISLNATLQLGRLLPPTTLSQSQTVPTTGKGHQDARSATGTVIFYNGQFTQVFVPAGTTLTGNSGEQIVTDQDAQIPPESQTIPPTLGQATVSAHAVTPGSKGNIPTGDINQTCCAPSMLVQNTAFRGGQDERDFKTVTKQDISNVTMTLKTTLSESMQGALTGQLKSGEALVTPTCTPIVTADHHPGDEAEQVKVTVSETCSAVTYNTQELENKATQLLTAQAIQKLGTGYSLLGNLQVTVNQANVTGLHPTVAFSCSGVWVYALSNAAQEHIKDLIKGKTTQDALQILASQPGIERVSTQWDENTKLPKDARYIHLVILAGI